VFSVGESFFKMYHRGQQRRPTKGEPQRSCEFSSSYVLATSARARKVPAECSTRPTRFMPFFFLLFSLRSCVSSCNVAAVLGICEDVFLRIVRDGFAPQSRGYRWRPGIGNPQTSSREVSLRRRVLFPPALVRDSRGRRSRAHPPGFSSPRRPAAPYRLSSYPGQVGRSRT